ncbi:MAG: helix-turn-helix domain-containing protein [Planctomycetes bacterium]|nr:helix-turn-helix domain-containing protein [Planctomycetota bacterium]
MPKLMKQLQALVRADGRGVRELSRASGVEPASISRLMNGHAGLSAGHVEDLARALGYSVTFTPTPKLKKRSK